MRPSKKKRQSQKAAAQNSTNRQDGWMNLMTGLGRKGDKSQGNEFSPSIILHKEELTNLWNGEGLGSRIVSAPAEDMTRAWIDISDDKGDKISDELDRLDAEQQFQMALTWQRLYGGSIMVIGTPDAESLEDPLPANVKGISFIKVYPKSRVDIYSADIITDASSEHFEEVERYQVRRVDGQSFYVHHTRVIAFKGLPFADDTSGISWEDRYWGMSALQQPWDQIRTFGSTMQGIASLLQEYTVGVYKLSNLAQMLAEGQEDAIHRRIDIINTSKSLINAVLLGEGEEFTRNTASLSGIHEVLDRFMMFVSGVVGIPVTRLFGRSAGGLNNNGDNDMQQYYDMIGSLQKTKLRPAIQKFLTIVNGYIKSSPEPVSFTFNPVWEPSQAELIEMRHKQAETDEKYINLGVVDADEIREARFAGEYSFETAVEGEAPEPPEPTVPEKKQPKQIEEE